MSRSSSFQSAISRAPLLRLVLPFVAGLLIAQGRSINLWLVGACLLLLAMAWHQWISRGRVYEFRWLRGSTLMAVIFLFGVFWQQLRAPEKYSEDLSRERTSKEGWRVTVTEVASSNERVLRAWCEVDAALDSAGAIPVHGRVLVTLAKDTSRAEPTTGDELLVLARVDTIDRVPDPGGFDQRAWASSYGVYHQCFAPAEGWKLLRKARGLAAFFDTARDRIVEWLKTSDLDGRERGMVKAILLGIRDELDQDQKAAFARSGTMHVLAVSGSHVALIYGVLLWGFKSLGERRRWRILRSVLILLVLWGYAGLTGATPSVMRATATFTLFCVADMFGRQTDAVNSLAGAAFLLLLWDPIVLWQLSFQLSFLAVLGIALFYRPILHLWEPPNRLLYYFWSLFSVSMAAQSMTTPLSLLAFKAFPVWFLPANLVIVGLVALGVYGGAALLVLRLFPVVDDIATGFMVLLLKAIDYCSDLFAHLPGAYPAVRVSAWQAVGLYAFVLLLAAWLLEGRDRARTALIAVTGVLLVSWGWNAHARNGTKALVIYDERDKLVCAIESGRTLTVYADTLDAWTAKKITQHERTIGAWRVDTVPRVPATIALDDMHVRFLGARWQEEDTLLNTASSLVVLKEDARFDPAAIVERFHPSEGLVLAPTVSAKHRAYLRRWCEEHAVAVHDVRLRGAYVR